MTLAFSVDDALLLSGLLIRDIAASRVVIVCLSVRRSRSSVDLMLFVLAVPDNVFLCCGRSGPDAGDLMLGFCCDLAVLSWVFIRGMREDIFSPAVEPFAFLLSVWDGYLFKEDIAEFHSFWRIYVTIPIACVADCLAPSESIAEGVPDAGC